MTNAILRRANDASCAVGSNHSNQNRKEVKFKHVTYCVALDETHSRLSGSTLTQRLSAVTRAHLELGVVEAQRGDSSKTTSSSCSSVFVDSMVVSSLEPIEQ